MTDEIRPPIDPDHPWVEASHIMGPVPVQAHMKAEQVEIEQNGQSADAVLITIIDATGVKTSFFPPQAFIQFLVQGSEVIEALKNKHMMQGGLIVPSRQMEQQMKESVDKVTRLRSVD